MKINFSLFRQTRPKKTYRQKCLRIKAKSKSLPLKIKAVMVRIEPSERGDASVDSNKTTLFHSASPL